MHYQDRIRIAASIVTEFLRYYQRPGHLDNEMATREIAAIAEEVNALAPTSLSPEEFKGRVTDACRYLRQTYAQRGWPVVAHFIKAMEAMASKAAKNTTSAPVSADHLSPAQIAAQRIRNGEDVGDGWLYGRLALQLVSDGLVTEGDLQPYRDRMRHRISSMYTPDQAARILGVYDQRHTDAAGVAY